MTVQFVPKRIDRPLLLTFERLGFFFLVLYNPTALGIKENPKAYQFVMFGSRFYSRKCDIFKNAPLFPEKSESTFTFSALNGQKTLLLSGNVKL